MSDQKLTLDPQPEPEIIYVEEQAPEPWTVREPIYDKDLPIPYDSDSELGRIRMTSGMVPSPLMRLKSPSSDASSSSRYNSEDYGRISPLPMLDASVKSGKKGSSIYSALDDSSSCSPVMKTLCTSPSSSADMADVESNVSMAQFEDSDLDEEAAMKRIPEFNQNLVSTAASKGYADLPKAGDCLDSKSTLLSQEYSASKKVQNNTSINTVEAATLNTEYHMILLDDDLDVPIKTHTHGNAQTMNNKIKNRDIIDPVTLNKPDSNIDPGTLNPTSNASEDHGISDSNPDSTFDHDIPDPTSSTTVDHDTLNQTSNATEDNSISDPTSSATISHDNLQQSPDSTVDHDTINQTSSVSVNRGILHQSTDYSANHGIMNPIALISGALNKISNTATPYQETNDSVMLLDKGLDSESNQQHVNNTSNASISLDKEASSLDDVKADDQYSVRASETSKAQIIQNDSGTVDLEAGDAHTTNSDAIISNTLSEVSDAHIVDNPENIDINSSSALSTATSSDSENKNNVSFDVIDKTPILNDHVEAAAITQANVEGPAENIFTKLPQQMSGSEGEIEDSDLDTAINSGTSSVNNDLAPSSLTDKSHLEEASSEKIAIELADNTPVDVVKTGSYMLDSPNTTEIVGGVEPWAASVKDKIIAIEPHNAAKAGFQNVESNKLVLSVSEVVAGQKEDSDIVLKEVEDLGQMDSVPDNKELESKFDTLGGAGIVGGLAAASAAVKGKTAAVVLQSQIGLVDESKRMDQGDNVNPDQDQDDKFNTDQDRDDNVNLDDEEAKQSKRENKSEGSSEIGNESYPSIQSEEEEAAADTRSSLSSSKINLSDQETSDDQNISEVTEPPVPAEATALLATIISSEIPELSDHLKSLGLNSDALIKELASNPNLRNKSDNNDDNGNADDLVEDSVNFLMFNSDELMKVKTREEAIDHLNSLHNYDESILEEVVAADQQMSAEASELTSCRPDQERTISLLTAKTRNADDLLRKLAELIKELNAEIVALTDENNEQRSKISELEKKTQ